MGVKRLSAASVLIGFAAVAAACNAERSQAEPAEQPLQEFVVMVSGALSAPYAEILPEFERRTGATVVTVRGGSTGDNPNTIPNRLARGEPADVVILAGGNVDELIAGGLVAPGSRVDLAGAEVWGAVPEGAEKPDISTVEAFIAALRAAPAIALASSVSGIVISTETLPRLGVWDELSGKTIFVGTVGTALAAGEAQIGFQNYSELLPIDGIEMLGPLPAEIGIVSVFSAGVGAAAANPELAREFIELMASVPFADAYTNAGLRPLHGR